MHLIEILLPLSRGDGTAVSSRDLEDARAGATFIYAQKQTSRAAILEVAIEGIWIPTCVARLLSKLAFDHGL